MGTSSSFGGPAGATPLVPSWLDDADGDAAPDADVDAPEGAEGPENEGVDGQGDSPLPSLPPVPEIGPPNRFRVPRGNLSRFAKSNGESTRNLGRAISRYVGSSSGGARSTATRMGASRRSAARLVTFLSDTIENGPREALRRLDLEELSGLPVDRVFVGLADYICPASGSVDDGIARAALIDTIVDLATEGLPTLEELTVDQMQGVIEVYATNTIMGRLCNDIGSKVISLPRDSRAADRVQRQLKSFIRRGVADALTRASVGAVDLTPARVQGYVNTIYEESFAILQSMGERIGE